MGTGVNAGKKKAKKQIEHREKDRDNRAEMKWGITIITAVARRSLSNCLKSFRRDGESP
jgi:hypothetical protein